MHNQARYLLVFTLMIILIGNVSATPSLGTFQLNNDVQLTQGCDDSTYANISRIIYPNSSFALDTETVMTPSAGGDNYAYTFTSTGDIGQYLVYGRCDEGGTDTVWVYDFWISSTGDQVSSSNTIIVVVFLILSIVLLALGWSFSSEHWILRTFFNFGAVGMGILAVNSAKIIASESPTLGVMGTTGLTIMIVVFALFFLYIFVHAFIEVIKSFQRKEAIRWGYD